ncbi:MAG TPA: hypothetical protein VG056_12300 [Pirellulales bacterium]|jgi:hypothetical protein|nr:hypothetical protein [Pirellulales bacterium]
MTAERAIHDCWSGYRPLSALVPPERVYTGLPPLRDAMQHPITFPYVSLSALADADLTRTSSGTMFTTERIRFSIYTRDYDEGRHIDQAICDCFNRREFLWSRGRVLDMKPGDRTESEDPEDGVWRIARDFQIRLTDTSGSKTQ